MKEASLANFNGTTDILRKFIRQRDMVRLYKKLKILYTEKLKNYYETKKETD